MRYVLPAVLVVIGLLTGILGVLQKTVWAPSDTLVASVQLDEPGPVVVVEPGVLNLYGTPAELDVTAGSPDQDITISRTTKENADAWVGASDVTRITGLADEETLAHVTSTGGEGTPAPEEPAEGEAAEDDAAQPDPEELATVPAPGGADLWESTVSGTGSASLTFDEEAGRTAFVIGTDGEQPAASEVSLTWPADDSTPWALPLMIAGGVLLLAGGVLGFFAIRRSRSEAERRRARQERRRKLAETGSAFAIVPVIALAGCGPAELPQPEPAPVPSTPAAAVTDEQLAEVLNRIAEQVAAADEGLDAEALGARAQGPFLDQRKAAYEVKEAAEETSLPPAVAADEVLVNHTSQTDQWPRATSAVVRDAESGDTQLLVLTQQDARADFTVWSQTVLQPGAELPEVADAREGSALLAPDEPGLRLPPNEVATAYADVLSSGDESDSAGVFAEDAFVERVRSGQSEQRDALEDGGAEIEFEYTGSEDQLTAMATADGSALVTGVVETRSTITPDSTESTTGTLSLPSPASEIVGESSTSDPLEQTTTAVVTWVVPAGDEDQIRMVGVNEVYTGAELG
ncbi:hypothetical protein [Brevibacterium album]|uniref:hypothetical protein n=1 Tax=Brevibacterium album TaxID=417948 RepID=UPI000425300C|nr:hypothetical protein [Brevibacterium album]